MEFNNDTAIETILIFTILGGIALGIILGYEYFLITLLALVALVAFHKMKNNRLIREGKERLRQE